MNHEYPGYGQHESASQGSADSGAYGRYGGGQFNGAATSSAPDNSLAFAIISVVISIVSCYGIFILPLGIISIVKAKSSESLWGQGQAVRAQQAASDARKFAIWALALTAGVLTVVALVNLVSLLGILVVTSQEFGY